MPNNIIKSFAEKANKSINEVEKLWKKAKEIAENSKTDNIYAYAVSILKKMLKIEEEISMKKTLKNFTEFLEAASIKIPEDAFDSFAYLFPCSAKERSVVIHWLYNRILNENDEFIKEALRDVLEGCTKIKNYKAGINILIKNVKFSIYSLNGVLYITCEKPIDKFQIIKIFKG